MKSEECCFDSKNGQSIYIWNISDIIKGQIIKSYIALDIEFKEKEQVNKGKRNINRYKKSHLQYFMLTLEDDQ